jgi:hypothetical protein
MGGRGARDTRDTRRKTDKSVQQNENTSSVLDQVYNTYTDDRMYDELEILTSNHVQVIECGDGPQVEKMTDEIFIKHTETKKEVKSKLQTKIKRLTNKLGEMKKKVQKLLRKKSVIEDVPTEYDRERQNFVNDLAARCTRGMNEFIARSYNVTKNVIEANSSEQIRQSKQNPNRKKRPSRSEKEKRDRQKEVEFRKKEKFFERAKQIQQRRSKRKSEVTKHINQQKQIKKGELNYKTLLLIMNQRDRHEQQTGIGENPYTKELNVKPYSFTETFKKNERVIQSNNELNEIHRKRKIERELIDEQQAELVKKIAKTNEEAIAA